MNIVSNILSRQLKYIEPVLDRVLKKTMSRCSTWSKVEMGPADPILGVTVAFKADNNPKKMNLGVGAYRDGLGKPYVLKAVKKAEEKIANTPKEYSPILGNQTFSELAFSLAFGKEESANIKKKSVSMQSLSGTGALRVSSEFLKRFYSYPNDEPCIYIPNPSWGNHKAIFQTVGSPAKQYTYYNPENCGLNFDGMMKDLTAIPDKSVVLLHACAHNPTGVDISEEQWKEVSTLFKRKQLFPYFDMAYQGFATGNISRDAFAPRYFAQQGHELILCQSFAKNMGLYGERVGALHFVTNDASKVEAIASQLKLISRPMYSNPPIHGALIAATILADPTLYKEWEEEVKMMSERIFDMRTQLKENLIQLGNTRNWNHITNQIGMFCFTGLTKEQVLIMREKYSIYFTLDGRISLAGINSNNVLYLAKAIHDVTQ